MFSKLQDKKIKNIQKIISSKNQTKPRLNMTMKRLSRKQIIVPINSENTKNFMKDMNTHVTNINRALKNIKSDITADFIQLNNKEVVITTNKVAGTLDLQTIEKYIKNINNIESNYVEALKLPQLKSYLKIISIFYILEDANLPITADMVKKIIKDNHIFNNIILVLRPRVIKISLKSDTSIIWFDIWDIQSGSRAKGLINRYFNVGSYIAII